MATRRSDHERKGSCCFCFFEARCSCFSCNEVFPDFLGDMSMAEAEDLSETVTDGLTERCTD